MLKVEGMFPGGHHLLLPLFEGAGTGWFQFIELLRIDRDHARYEVLFLQRAIRKFAVWEDAEVGIWFFFVGLFFELRCVLFFEEPFAEGGVDEFAGLFIIIVGVIEDRVVETVFGAEEFVNSFDGGAFDFHHFLGPIAGRGDDDLGTRRNGGGNFHVGVIDAQPGRIFTKATALHGMRNHDDGRLCSEAFIDGAENEGLSAAAGFAGAGEARFVDVRK